LKKREEGKGRGMTMGQTNKREEKAIREKRGKDKDTKRIKDRKNNSPHHL
jgi:hypothetical protein